MIKLRYTNDHYVRILGDDGNTVFTRVHRDMVEDGMEVQVTASGTDKLKAERRAMDMAGMKLIDPLTFYKDVGASDPHGRTKKLMTFMMSPEQYMAEFVMGLKDSAAMGEALNGQTGGQQALMDIAQMQQGQMPPVPENVDAEYLDTLTTFMQSPEFMALPPELQQAISSFAEQVLNIVSSQTQEQPQQPSPSDQFGGSAAGPSPMDTTKVATEPQTLAPGSTRRL
jgi:hypothetical protein